ncbi:hypothetical protein [Pseudogracilibacillus sp. SO30301A]
MVKYDIAYKLSVIKAYLSGEEGYKKLAENSAYLAITRLKTMKVAFPI